MPDIVRATFGGLELRVPDRSERIVEGIVVPWNETSYMTDNPKGERFLPGSLTRTVTERGHLVKLCRSHDHTNPMGTAVKFDPNHPDGLWAQFRVTKKPIGDDLLSDVEERLFDAFSVGFRLKRETKGADGAREIVEASLHEVSLCPMGAYDGARVLAMRSTGHTGPSQSVLPPMPTVNLAPLVLPPRWTR